ncbi:GNAT family N-acetyltransferase [Schumannella sp. 10F1B-5-1]|uniref:GNAT family N-acetyltransferase n=1 Tax=Schumannella sp. 10F1B-5-1 TaxID=2590780 RepID=UPI0011302AFF|nr:GNAT family N-acetyltransferase [Schumannella sp. 10F1B-5-1]TPW78426.1 GNAT family N-acetyltransferase [Schumannella sp. 10F1B-5-1]
MSEGHVTHDGVIHERLPQAEGASAAGAPVAGTPRLRWVRRWETQLDDGELDRIREFLTRVFPNHPGGIQKAWAGSRPEVRLLGFDPADPASGGDPDSTAGELLAHIGITRRFLRSRQTGESVLIGDVGLVGVSPDRQGQGLGKELMRQTDASLAELGVAFGTLTTGENQIPFYSRAGWQIAPEKLHAIDLDDHREVFDGPFFFRPVLAPAAAWLPGELERNGREI